MLIKKCHITSEIHHRLVIQIENMDPNRRMNVEEALAMLQAMSEAESEGGEKTDGESDEGGVKDPSTEEESSSEDWEPIPRKRPRVLVAGRL